MTQQNPYPRENHYGGTLRHHPENDKHIEENFTPDNQDYLPNSVEYNDREETRFASGDRLAPEHHNLPEKRSGDLSYKPSNYSEGGHGRPITLEKRQDNSDNKDYAMNKDSAQGAKVKYENSEEKHTSKNSP